MHLWFYSIHKYIRKNEKQINTTSIPKSNRKNVERDEIDTQSHNSSPYWLGTCTSIKRGGVKGKLRKKKKILYVFPDV